MLLNLTSIDGFDFTVAQVNNCCPEALGITSSTDERRVLPQSKKITQITSFQGTIPDSGILL